ncbi:ATP-binding Cassette (ABC) Superfamily [Phytophthora infestans T30-4]|uniref:ATP-binding Cassette (ABC) Superfamily n=1 Tax=Phytophthora infestans (strain T30-4) TaxID=403677 RepID=D0MRX3_PHYIT|nr:ATP-binding Cassette (ABC) Superfamily [Phytophthora infestans T30-4]EEY58242.1 ATP-binding Cassette (ABC) Superfamily [Phytophthora infestans T30-4]|eukprot:XP_002909428.1 ATP-binding Cassette (ABC) Superfamily [Phytophthora infestans T30-4]
MCFISGYDENAVGVSPFPSRSESCLLGTRHCSVGEMAGLWSSVGVLLWKNWRVKQRESRFNRGRLGKRWLYPALVTDIIIPLGLILLLIQKMCQYNAQLVTPGGGIPGFGGMRRAMENESDGQLLQAEQAMMASNEGDLTEELTQGVQQVKHEFATLLLTALPLLLAKSNQSLAILQRQDSQLFLQHLNREYPAATQLGISSYADRTKMIPFNNTASNEEANRVMLEFPMKSGWNIYAGLDVRRAESESEDEVPLPLELLTLFYQKTLNDPSEQEQEDQLAKFFSKDLTFNRTMMFPDVMPFQMSLNMFIRENSTKFVNNEIVDLDSLSPEIICQAVDKMLDVASLQWGDFPATSPLGRSVLACKIAVKKGGLSAELRYFLANLIAKAISSDELDTLTVSALPKRPANTVAGPLEGNIVFYLAYLFLWPYVRLVRDVVAEKEKQLKEYLMIMGLPAMSLLISWFLLYFLASVVVSLIGTWLLSGSMFAASTDGDVYFFLLLVTFVSSILLFGLAITPIFTQTKTAAACAPLIYFIMSAGSFLRSLVGDDVVASNESLALLLFVLDGISSPVVFMGTMHDILAFDAVTLERRHITYHTVATPIRLMASQCAGYLLLGWYLENVFPRTYGVQQKWYFVFQPSYWFPTKVDLTGSEEENEEAMRLTDMGRDTIHDQMDETLREQSLPEYLEHSRPTLFVQSLSKTYPNGKVALSNVSFGVRKGEIFGLLGPNGAGKSTTLSILSGILSPTSGDAYVGGSISVANNPQAVRTSLSVCFQQNILFDNLTVWEHLSLVCALKATMGVKTVSEQTRCSKLQQFGLDEKRDALAKTLSGGQKRKLSLVLSLLDSSRVLLLDEPTAGMDMKARLDTWDALKRAVTHRAVILTTHSMQEAQALCENIGIVAEGKLKCCGSSLFLRNRFGVGYKLTVVHHDEEHESAHRRSQREQWADLLMTTLRKYVPNAAIVSDNKWETRVQLNDGDEQRFAALFRELETMKKKEIIKRYAIAATDLEDVFVKVTEGEDVYYHEKDDVDAADPVRTKMETDKAKTDLLAAGSDRPLPGWQHATSQLRALIIKRVKMSSRDKKSLFAQYVWPIGFFAILMAVLQHLLDSRGSIETVTTLSPAAKDASFFIASASSMTDSVADLVAQFEHKSHPIVFDQSATTEQEMLDAIARANTTTFFAGIFVSNVNWTADNTVISPVLSYALYYNETVRRSLPVTLQWMSQAYCKARAAHEKSPGIDNCDLEVKRGVFPIEIEIGTGVTSDEEDGVALDPDEAVNVVRRIMVAFYLLMTMSSVVGFYVAPVVREKESGLKRIQYQHLETANASCLYWLSNFLFDYMVYTSAAVIICVILAIFSGCLTAEIIAAWFASMAIFGLAILPAQYLSSLVFASHSSAQSYMSYLSLFQIMAASIVFALSMIPGLCTQVNLVTYVLQLFPLYSFSTAVLNIVTVSWAPMRHQCLEAGGDLETSNPFAMLEGLIGQPKVSVWAWEVTGSSWCALVLSGVLYTLLLLIMDQYQMYPTLMEHTVRHKLHWLRGLLPCRRHSRGYTEADQSPAAFDEESPNSDMVRVVRVSQIFNPRKKTSEEQEGAAAVLNESGQVVALDDVSFAVEKRDCVALLGVNGSGKSTMFEILTAGIAPTSGKALIDSCDVTVQPREASVRYGYCSQGNHYFNDLSVREHLELFYRLRCSRSNALMSEDAVIDELMRRLDLFPVEKTAASHLSGGNKRRLMLALALLSDHTSLLLLDEPSAGVDVVARRLMWRVLHEKRQSLNRTSCLFTTHSMEEAEAVCANAVVLFKGKVVWSGSIPDLKQRVARGISISVRLDSASIWNAEEIQNYTQQIRRSIKDRPTTNARREGLERNSIPLRELEEAYELCHNLFHKNGDAATAAVSRQHGKTWLEGLRSRFESDENDVTPNKEEPVIPLVEFVQEWLVQEAFAGLETRLFKDQVTARSGELVVSAELETARGSGSNTSGVYETSCTDSFGLADVFAIMEDNKKRFHIAQYSVSELSLERVFEQFTG